MCEYCVHHGSGKRWYQNARNYSKTLAMTELVEEFCNSYFARDIKPNSVDLKNQFKFDSADTFELERKKTDYRYRKFVHHQVVTTDEAVSILKLASLQTGEHERAVVRIPCICRHVVSGADEGLHCYGIAFTDDYTRRFPKYLGGGHEYLSADNAIHMLEDMVMQEPIVHAITALGVPYLGLLCNCDMKVCQPYLRRVSFGIDSPFHKGHYAATVDTQKCSGCGTCEASCPFKVASLNHDESTATIDSESCFGCGICISRCPEGAISFIDAPRTTGF
ncbi:MAG: 4Fe-4S dicluster domain-containing protein [Candidatus Thorarchaeota archaeon]